MPKKESKTEIIDWNALGQTGFEHVDQSELGIPFLKICQSNSPEFDKTDPDYATRKIQGIEPGDIFHSTDRRVVAKHGGDPVIVVPYTHKRAWVEWKDRKSGGGYVTTHVNPSILGETSRRPDSSHDWLPNGNIIVTTAYVFCYLVEVAGEPQSDEDGNPIPVVIAMTSTQLAKDRAWLNMMKQNKQGNKTLPMFSRRYALNTIGESNADGSWFGWKIEPGDMVEDRNLVEHAVEDGRQTVALIAMLPDKAPSGAEDIPI